MCIHYGRLCVARMERMNLLHNFYRCMLWCLRHEIVIARSTGRNPANIQQLQREISELELKQWELEINSRIF